MVVATLGGQRPPLLPLLVVVMVVATLGGQRPPLLPLLVVVMVVATLGGLGGRRNSRRSVRHASWGLMAAAVGDAPSCAFGLASPNPPSAPPLLQMDEIMARYPCDEGGDPTDEVAASWKDDDSGSSGANGGGSDGEGGGGEGDGKGSSSPEPSPSPEEDSPSPEPES